MSSGSPTYQKAWHEDAKLRMQKYPERYAHGTMVAYNSRGCRCADCCLAAKMYRLNRKNIEAQ